MVQPAANTSATAQDHEMTVDDARGDWDGAHQIAQDVSGADAAWVHAYLHRKEGDSWLSREMAGRSGPAVETSAPPNQEEDYAHPLVFPQFTHL
jgi:hypothetical protein